MMNPLGDLKIKYKLFFIVGVFLILTFDALFVAYTSQQDISSTFSDLKDYALPVLETTSELKDNLNLSLLALDNYLLTKNDSSFTSYQNYLRDTYNSEIKLFRISETANDFAFTKKFNDRLNDIALTTQQLVQLRNQDASETDIQTALEKLFATKDTFNDFLKTEINQKIENQVAQSRNDLESTSERITYTFILFTGIIFVLVIFTVWFTKNNITGPIRLLTQAAEKFGKGKFEKVNLERNDELGLFGKTFNTMAGDILKTRVYLEEELAKTKGLDRQKSEFLSIAAHQLRTPLSGIKWTFQMLLDEDLGKTNKEQKHFLSRGLDNTDRLVRLINDLLDVSRLEEQRFQYKMELLSPENLVEDVAHSLAEKARSKGIAFSTEAETPLPKVPMDKQKMSIALMNLIDNGINYSKPHGKVHIKIFQVPNVQAPDAIEFQVKDSGYGIPKSEQYRIFSKFYRGSNIQTVHTDGTGLGLFLVKDVITKHGGDIWFESEENKGTTFSFTLPLKPVQV